MVKGNRAKIILNLLFFFLIVIDIFYLYRINTIYRGVYEIQIFIPLILVFIMRFIYLIRSKNKMSKNSPGIELFILCLIPLIIYSTKPKYTYDSGKEVLRKDLNLNYLEFDESKENYSIPIKDKEYLFIKNMEYYYTVKLNDGNSYFRVNPNTGLLNELSTDFY